MRAGNGMTRMIAVRHRPAAPLDAGTRHSASPRARLREPQRNMVEHGGMQFVHVGLDKRHAEGLVRIFFYQLEHDRLAFAVTLVQGDAGDVLRGGIRGGIQEGARDGAGNIGLSFLRIGHIRVGLVSGATGQEHGKECTGKAIEHVRDE